MRLISSLSKLLNSWAYSLKQTHAMPLLSMKRAESYLGKCLALLYFLWLLYYLNINVCSCLVMWTQTNFKVSLLTFSLNWISGWSFIPPILVGPVWRTIKYFAPFKFGISDAEWKYYCVSNKYIPKIPYCFPIRNDCFSSKVRFYQIIWISCVVCNTSNKQFATEDSL